MLHATCIYWVLGYIQNLYMEWSISLKSHIYKALYSGEILLLEPYSRAVYIYLLIYRRVLERDNSQNSTDQL